MIEKLTNGSHLVSLDNIMQWSELDGHIKESVSQHSFKVSVFVLAIVEELFIGLNEETINFKYKCLASGLLHDFDEHYIKRDLSHEVKYNSFNGIDIKSAIDSYSRHVASKDFSENEFVSGFFLNRIFECDSAVKSVVKVADWLGLLHHLKREELLGNNNVKQYIYYCKNSLHKAVDIMSQTLNRNKLIHDNLVIMKLKNI